MCASCGCSGQARRTLPPAPHADPGYLSDRMPRYPLDTEGHVRAAWGYINQHHNARLYTAPQRRLIHAQIQRAGKRFGIQYGHARSRGRTASRAARRAGSR